MRSISAKNALSLLIALAALGLALGLAFGLSGCASASPPRLVAYAVAGASHTVVFIDGLPQTPNAYEVVPVSADAADIYRGGRYIGRALYEEVPGKPGSVRIDISPGSAIVQITGR